MPIARLAYNCGALSLHVSAHSAPQVELTLAYVPSRPKFEKYSTAQIVEEALLLGALRGDLKSDEEKGFLRRGRPHKSVVTTQLLVASIAPPPCVALLRET